MKRMTHLPVILLLILVASTAALAQDAIRIAVFDPQRVSEETAEGLRVQAWLTSLRNEKQAELLAIQSVVTDLQTQFTTQSLSLSPGRKQALEIEIQKKALEFQNAQEAAGRELQLEINAAQAKFQEQLLAVVEQYGRDEGFDLILDRSMVAWTAPSMDVTTALVDRFNQWVGAQTAAPTAAPTEAATEAEAGSGQ